MTNLWAHFWDGKIRGRTRCEHCGGWNTTSRSKGWAFRHFCTDCRRWF